MSDSPERTEPTDAIVPLDDSNERATNEQNDDHRDALIAANAAECARNKRETRNHELHSSNAMRYLLGLGSSAQQRDTTRTHNLLAGLEEEDRQLFSDIPKELKGRTNHRTSSDREGSMNRRAEYHNANYTAPEKHQTSSPRAIVDIRRPLTARYDPNSPLARESRSKGSSTSRYTTTALANDPTYTPSPTSRRSQIEAAKNAERSLMARPLTTAQLETKRGTNVIKEKPPVAKKDPSWYPALATLAEGRNAEGKARRQEVQSRQNPHIFK